jgi:hypothetical protein
LPGPAVKDRSGELHLRLPKVRADGKPVRLHQGGELI